MNTTEKQAKLVYNMLSFQYKPLEKMMKKQAPAFYKEYLGFPYIRKIAVLDKLAQHYGL